MAEVLRDIRPLVLRPNQAAYALSMGRDKLFALLASGEIRSYLDGNSRFIPVAEIDAYIQRRIDAST